MKKCILIFTVILMCLLLPTDVAWGQTSPNILQVTPIKNIAELCETEPSSPSRSMFCFVTGYHTDGDGGGGTYVWNTAQTKTEHNGGTIIDPDVTFPTTWSNSTQQTAWFTAGSSGTGCWVLANANNSPMDIRIFGAKDDVTADSYLSIQSALDTGAIFIPMGAFYTETALKPEHMITGEDRFTTFLVSKDDGVAIDSNKNSLYMSNLTLLSKTCYDNITPTGSPGTHDTSGIGVLLDNRPTVKNCQIWGFGDVGLYIAGTSYNPGVATYNLILGDFNDLNIQNCGSGIKAVGSSASNDFTTTTKFRDIYIAGCDYGMYAYKLDTAILDNFVCEYCAVGAYIEDSLVLALSWYFEKNTRPYIVFNGRGTTIINENLDNNTQDPLVWRNKGSVVVSRFSKKTGSVSKLQSIGFYYDDATTPTASRTQLLSTMAVNAGGELQLEDFPRDATSGASYTASVVTQFGDHNSFMVSVNVSSTGTLLTTNPVVSSVSRVAVGEYLVTLGALMNISDITATPFVLYSSGASGLDASISFSTAQFSNVTSATPFCSSFYVTIQSSAGTLTDAPFSVSFLGDNH